MKREYNISLDYLKREYLEQDRTMTSISEEIGCCKSTVRNYLIKYGMAKNMSLVGQTFTRLTVIDRFYTSGDKYKGKRMWNCQCECGNSSILSTHELKSGNTRSCGCWNRVNRHNHKNWKGHEEITGKWWGGIKRGALKRGYNFDITIDYAWQLYLSQNKKCSLSGVPIKFANTNRDKATASLDRIDNTQGYIEGNVQWVHKDINLMKQKFTQKYFIEMCEKIAWKNK